MVLDTRHSRFDKKKDTMKEKKKELSVGFEVVIKEEEGKFTGEVKELPGLIVSGAGQSDVLKNIRAAQL